jgi:hypothetical protein
MRAFGSWKSRKNATEDTILHAAVFDAMGHGLEAATMATVAGPSPQVATGERPSVRSRGMGHPVMLVDNDGHHHCRTTGHPAAERTPDREVRGPCFRVIAAKAN